jgi:nitroreductase
MELITVLENRWSPRAYQPRAVEVSLAREVFAAARLAQSSNNEQPWRFRLFAPGDPERAAAEALLAPGNSFAKEAWYLGVAFAKTHFTKDGSINVAAALDTGAACQLLALRAFELGLNSRFMAGFDFAAAARFAPLGAEPVAMFALGYATPEALANPWPKRRKTVDEFVSGLDTPSEGVTP